MEDGDCGTNGQYFGYENKVVMDNGTVIPGQGSGEYNRDWGFATIYEIQLKQYAAMLQLGLYGGAHVELAFWGISLGKIAMDAEVVIRIGPIPTNFAIDVTAAFTLSMSIFFLPGDLFLSLSAGFKWVPSTGKVIGYVAVSIGYTHSCSTSYWSTSYWTCKIFGLYGHGVKSLVDLRVDISNRRLLSRPMTSEGKFVAHDADTKKFLHLSNGGPSGPMKFAQLEELHENIDVKRRELLDTTHNKRRALSEKRAIQKRRLTHELLIGSVSCGNRNKCVGAESEESAVRARALLVEELQNESSFDSKDDTVRRHLQSMSSEIHHRSQNVHDKYHHDEYMRHARLLSLRAQTETDFVKEKKGIFDTQMVNRLGGPYASKSNRRLDVLVDEVSAGSDEEHPARQLRRHLQETDFEAHALLQELHDIEWELYEYQQREERRILVEEPWESVPNFGAALIEDF
jgi:hypothetical protein